MLKQVRLDNPTAYILYKPHPDVVAGLRVGGISESDLELYADAVESDIAITHLYQCIDELHTITSLSGFEALIRGVRVYCYGMPFYAGWGLTHDRHINHRRKVKLSLEALMHAVIIDYPSYNHPQPIFPHMSLCSPEAVIDHLMARKNLNQQTSLTKMKTLYLSFTRLKQWL